MILFISHIQYNIDIPYDEPFIYDKELIKEDWCEAQFSKIGFFVPLPDNIACAP